MVGGDVVVVWCVGVGEEEGGVYVVGGGGGADETQTTMCFAPHWCGRTPGSLTPGVPPPRALDDEELCVIEG